MASSPQHEPTMEEILASIRKIISEDSSEPPPKPMAAEPEPEPQMEAEVLELTQEVHDDPPAPVMEEPRPVMMAAAPEPAPPPQPDVVFQPIQQEQPMSSSARAETPESDIFSDKTRKAVDSAFEQIDAATSQIRAVAEPRQATSFRPSSSSSDGDSVEAVFERAVADAVGPHIEQWMDGRKDEILTSLRPLIREWMDDHFPSILEGAVRDEVSRAMKARGR